MQRTRNAVSTAATSAVLVMSLIVGLGIGYLGSTQANNTVTTTKTIVSTYTLTTNLPQGTEVVQCVVTQYILMFYASIGSSTTVFGNTTSSSVLKTYQTSTSNQTVGYATTFTTIPTTTQTGYRTWNSTICMVVSG